MEFDTWLEKMHSEADDNLKDSIQAIRNNEKAKNYIKSSFMAHDDYTKKTQILAKEKTDLEDAVEKLKAWHQQEKPKNGLLMAELQKKEAELAAVKARIKEEVLLEPTPNSKETPTAAELAELVKLREEQNKLAQRLQAFDSNALQFNIDMVKVQQKANKEGFEADPEALYAFAAQNKVNLIAAYEALTSEARAAKAQADVDKRLKEAEERGYKSALTKHNLPDSPGRDTVAPMSALYREGIHDPTKRKEAALARFLETKV